MSASFAARAAAAGLVGALALTLGAGPAAAHNVVVDTTPSTDGTVNDAPADVSVTFDDAVLELGADGSSTVVQVTDDAGKEHATGCPATQDRTVSVPVSIDDAGEYTVAWRIVSADGHPTSGEFSFTYAPADGGGSDGASTGAGSGTDDAAGSDAGCATADGDATGGDGRSEAGGPGTADAEESGSGDLLVALGIAGAVVVLAGGGVLVALRVGRKRD